MSSSKLDFIKSKLEQYPLYQDKLFIRGYMITDAELPNADVFPFYGKWNDYKVSSFNVRVHNKQSFYCHNNGETSVFIIGNFVDPYDMEYDGDVLVRELSDSLTKGKEEFLKKANQLTGSFVIGIIEGSIFSFLTDPSGMLFSCYGIVNNQFYMSSHPQLLDDILGLTKSEYVKQLEKYKYFYKYGLFFPGDNTQYSELKRTLQNHITVYDGKTFSFKRFYPTQTLQEVSSEKDYVCLLDEAVGILHKTLDLCLKKWEDKRVAISLTGGMDSKTTLACAKGLYDKFLFYSYVSMLGDKIDAEAASKITRHIEVEHSVYNISENDSDFENIELVRVILEHNRGDYRGNCNDVRKRCFFSEGRQFDVEIKSWISEIARANYYKKFGLKRMPKIDSRRMTSMYKIFTTQRRLANETSQIFGDFIKKTGLNVLPKGYDESDMFLWEFRYSAWGGGVITWEHSYSNEIFIPYNNRNLLDLLLRSPQSKRVSDEFHHNLIMKANSQIEETGITITNWNETQKRMYAEKAYFIVAPFFTKKY